ncbi:CsbD family protein [Neisseria yangbaofengii]|uniref:CsbD family protein n=1 Tax=Neisseria yangbaofengii TaxID=2709396 RepID=UPI0013EE14E8|nr:CsbD family protein [Neisseria yangbaofengii]
MNWDQVEGKWEQLKGKAKVKWGELTDDDWAVVEGKRDQLAGRIQERYGYTKEQVEKELDDWANDR